VGGREKEVGVGLGKKNLSQARPGHCLYILPLRPDNPAPTGGSSVPPDHPALADRTIRPSIEEDPFKRWVYLDLECFEVGEWLRIELVTGERYSLPKFARIKLKGPNLDKFPPNKKIQRKSK
jgi:hypothetical protein